MREEEFLYEQYKFIREDLKRIVNEEEDLGEVRFWVDDVIDRIKYIKYLKKKIFERKELLKNDM